MSLRSKLRPLAFFVAISIGLATPAQAQTKLRMGVTPIGDYITAFVARAAARYRAVQPNHQRRVRLARFGL